MSEQIVVVGGGAAGMMAAVAAAECGCKVLLLERNEKLGKKLYITGKGRCNLTNACDTHALFDNVVKNAKFLYSAVYSFDNFTTMDFFGRHGVPLVTERGGRVFPSSGHASDITRALTRAMQRLGVEVKLNTRVRSINPAALDRQDAQGFLLEDASGATYPAKKVILASGGLSYPSTGSTGDGYAFAAHFGHTIIRPVPGLVAMYAKEAYVPKLQGLTLRNIRASIYDGQQNLFEDFGELLFTHFGVSGPMMLSASSRVGDRLKQRPLKLLLDLKPALSRGQLDRRILRDFEKEHNKQLKNACSQLLPSKLIPAVIEVSQIPPEKKVSELSKQARMRFLDTLKAFPVTLVGPRDFDEAIITRGGVDTAEINPSTMESKLSRGLFFAGEMIDTDAVTGGFNLQIAWSTGRLAGLSAAGGL